MYTSVCSLHDSPLRFLTKRKHLRDICCRVAFEHLVSTTCITIRKSKGCLLLFFLYMYLFRMAIAIVTIQRKSNDANALSCYRAAPIRNSSRLCFFHESQLLFTKLLNHTVETNQVILAFYVCANVKVVRTKHLFILIDFASVLYCGNRFPFAYLISFSPFFSNKFLFTGTRFETS